MKNEKVVWINGCFDILHRGHIELFKYAKSLGDKLFVGIDSDSKIKKDKGFDRPFNNLKDRVILLDSIKYIDQVKTFNSKEILENLIKNLTPDIIVVGSDWKGKEIVGGSYTKKIVYFDRIKNYSTTNILEWKNCRK